MEVRAKKSLGQHFLTDQGIARSIVDALFDGVTPLDEPFPVLEIGPGMGVLTQYLLERNDIDLRLVEIDGESVDYLLTHFPGMQGRLMQADFLRLRLDKIFPSRFAVIGNFPYNISSQIFFKILDHKDSIPEVVCMIQKEVAERIAEKPGTKTYGILSVLLQAWYDIEYLFTVGSGAFAPPPKVQSAVIRLRRNFRTGLGCDESLFKTVVKTSFNQRRKTLRNSLKPLLRAKAERDSALADTSTGTSWDEHETALDGRATNPDLKGWSGTSCESADIETTDLQPLTLQTDPIFDLRPERLSVEDFIRLTIMLS